MAEPQRCALPLVLLFLASGHGVAADGVDRLLDNALRPLTQATGTFVVGIAAFTYEDKNIGSGFSRYLEDKLGAALGRNPRFELSPRDRLEQILEVLALSLTDVFDQRTVVPVGGLKGIQGLLGGRFYDDGDSVRVFLELVDLSAGTARNKTEVRIPKTLLPEALSILPDNYNDALFVLQELAEVQNARNDAFVVKAWTPRGDGGTYRDGEDLVVHFYANRDCYLKMYHIDVHQQMKLIFPNQYFAGNSLKAGRICRIPDGSYPFIFKLTAPYGTEFIKVIASTVPFAGVEEAFKGLGAASRRSITRGLDLQARPEQITETLIRYTIVK